MEPSQFMGLGLAWFRLAAVTPILLIPAGCGCSCTRPHPADRVAAAAERYVRPTVKTIEPAISSGAQRPTAPVDRVSDVR